MKKTILIILFPVLLLAVFIQFNILPIQQEKATSHTVEASLTSFAADDSHPESEEISLNKTSVVIKSPGREPVIAEGSSDDKRESIVNYALTLLGSPYLFAGNTKDGFDCSGFTTHVFDQNGVAIKRSSGLQSTEGISVDRSEAAPGDLVIFTGTDKNVREPGHVGIVISEPGDTIEFVHASSSRSDGGVKISQVEGSGYDDRFLEVRRVL